MILYFTGTGNSLYVAKGLSLYLEDELVSINEYLRDGKIGDFASNKPYIIVGPIYTWRLPRVVDEFVKNSTFNGSKDVYVVCTMGENSGNADKYIGKTIKSKGLNFKGLKGVVMPNNFIYGEDLETMDINGNIIEKSIIKIKEIANSISNNEIISKDDKTPLKCIMSGIVNKSFYLFLASDKNFYVNNDCVLCGICEKNCPVNNIYIDNGKIKFKENCVWCFSCINRCPKKAINIKNNTEKKNRYVCIDFKD